MSPRRAAVVWALMAVIATNPGWAQTAAQLESAVSNLLRSGQEQDIAWGVYLAGRLRLRRFDPEIRRVFDAGFRQLRPGVGVNPLLLTAIDAVIELRLPFPEFELDRVHERFPDEAVILAARAPKVYEARLAEWFDESASDARWLAIGNLLAQLRTPGFALRLIRSLEAEVRVNVNDRPQIGGGSGGSVSAGDVAECQESKLAGIPGF